MLFSSSYLAESFVSQENDSLDLATTQLPPSNLASSITCIMSGRACSPQDSAGGLQIHSRSVKGYVAS